MGERGEAPNRGFFILVAWFIELVENMIAGFVQVEPVALLK